jgi:ribonuclease Y
VRESSPRKEAAAAADGRAAAAAAEQERRLEQIAGWTREEARAELSRKLEEDVRRQMASFIKRATEQAHEEADRTARTIVAQAIHRSSGRPSSRRR